MEQGSGSFFGTESSGHPWKEILFLSVTGLQYSIVMRDQCRDTLVLCQDVHFFQGSRSFILGQCSATCQDEERFDGSLDLETIPNGAMKTITGISLFNNIDSDAGRYSRVR